MGDKGSKDNFLDFEEVKAIRNALNTCRDHSGIRDWLLSK
jgi:hypothetical protein